MNKVIKTSRKEEKQSKASNELRRLNSQLPDIVTDEIEHSGVLGMRWGVRNDSSSRSSSSNAGSASKGASQVGDAERVGIRKDLVKNRRTASDAELTAAINRLQLEKRLKDLAEEDISPGRKMVEKMLGQAGSAVLGSVAGAVGGYLGKQLVNKLTGTTKESPTDMAITAISKALEETAGK